jgi:tRNA uridine 5-carboxymethylaminomethyl modification enzyme
MHSYATIYGVIVVGAGHAGCEAALAAARMGCRTLLLNMSLDGIAVMSCNPSIGGLAKGHLVREIDALGGEMGKNIDATGIQFRVLNTRKGPAVRAGRAQADKQLYRLRMKQVLEHQSYLDIKQAEVTALYFEQGVLKGVETRSGIRFWGETVVLTTGTFMRGLIHIGLINYSGGRAGDLPSLGLSDQLRDIGFGVGRLKTGTPARLDGRTIDFSKLEAQYSDDPPVPFSFSTERITMPQIPCYIAYTNPRTHEIIRGGLDRSPLYAGVIEGIGPRYCPSIEDKVVRFPEKERHQTFIEPEGLDTVEYYPSGMSTSLPIDVQIAFYRSMVGLEQVEIMRPAYGIEYDYVDPVELHATLETKRTPNLFHAGQINGTSGYEEAAGMKEIWCSFGFQSGMKLNGINIIILYSVCRAHNLDLFKANHRSIKCNLNINGKRCRHPTGVIFNGIQTFWLNKSLMPFFLREADDFILYRRAVSGTYTLDNPCIQRRAIKPPPDNFMRSWVSVGDIAWNLRHGNPLGAEGKRDRRIVTILGLKLGKIDGSSIKAGWCSCLKAAYAKTNVTQLVRQPQRRQITGSAT